MYANIYWHVCAHARVFVCIFSSILNPGKYLLLTTCHGSDLRRLAEERMGEEKMGAPMFPHQISKQLGKFNGFPPPMCTVLRKKRNNEFLFPRSRLFLYFEVC